MVTLRAAWKLIQRAAAAWMDDHAASMGAALSYYTVFSIAPLLLIAISIAGFVFGDDAARGHVSNQLQSLMGERGATAVEDLLASVRNPEGGVIATVIGAVLLLIGATTVLGELQEALDRIWQVPQRTPVVGWIAVLRTRLLSFGMILGMGFLLTVSLVASAAIAALGDWWGPAFGSWKALAAGINAAIDFVMVSASFAFIYKFMPRVRVHWSDVWIGAVVTAALFTLGKFLIGLYIGKSGIVSGFGAAGSLAVLLAWVYYSAQIFLFGAEFTWAYANEHGSRAGKAGKASR
jgi:membrane protein